MRFPRNTKIFRGQIDAAPVASVFFLMVLFLLLHTSLVFTPGIKVTLPEEADPFREVRPKRQVQIDESGRFFYANQRFDEKTFEKRFQAEVDESRQPGALIVDAHPAVNPEVLERLRHFTQRHNVALRVTGERVELPEAEGLPGSANASVVVAISLNGQIYFENQIVKEQELRYQLKTIVHQANTPISLILQADKAVPYERIVRLSRIAREAGIKEVLLAVRPKMLGATRPQAPGFASQADGLWTRHIQS